MFSKTIFLEKNYLNKESYSKVGGGGFQLFTLQSRPLMIIRGKHCGKRRKCGNQHFLLFQQYFLLYQREKSSFLATINLSSANAFHLVTSKILLFGEELNTELFGKRLKMLHLVSILFFPWVFETPVFRVKGLIYYLVYSAMLFLRECKST